MIYFDHSATTPTDPQVLEAMLPYFTKTFGNPSSIHQVGQSTRISLDQARIAIAKILNCSPTEIIFTSGGSESNNLAIKGICEAKKKGHIITTNIEHPAVQNVFEDLGKKGFEISYLEVDTNGILNPQKVKNALRKDTILISVMYANNEIGTIQPITKIGRIAENNNIPFHCDAVQAAATLSLDVERLKISMMSLSGHKIYGPKGIGVLYVKKGIQLTPQILGGGQEHRRRGGTENTPGIIGMTKALELVQESQEVENQKVKELRDNFVDKVLQDIPNTSLNGDSENRIVSNANICFSGIDGESLLMRLDMEGICASAGSACSAGSVEASSTLINIGLSPVDAESSLRFSFGRGNTMDEVEKTVEVLKKLCKELRK